MINFSFFDKKKNRVRLKQGAVEELVLCCVAKR
jgi:transposase